MLQIKQNWENSFLRLFKTQENHTLMYVGVIIFFLTNVLFSIFFRYASKDEAIYLLDSVIMSELIKKGIWFGNYAVGLHGFIFKIPAALSFVLVGPSVFAATLFNILLASLSLVLTYFIYLKLQNKRYWALALTALIATNFNFAVSTPTYLREIPMFLCTAVLTYALITKRNIYLIGISLVLLLDAKEYAFYAFLPGIVVYLFLNYDFVTAVKKIFSVVSLPVIYLLLSFSTGILPINMYNASILGLINNGFSWIKGDFITEVATYNQNSGDNNPPLQLVAPPSTQVLAPGTNTLKTNEAKSKAGTPALNYFLDKVNLVFLYLSKLLYPRTFGYLSISKAIIFPSVAAAIIKLREWYTEKSNRYLLALPLMYLSYMCVYIFRASHGRYLMPVTLFAYIFFIIFLNELGKKKRLYKVIIAITFIAVLMGVYYETTYKLVKLLMAIILIALLVWENTKYKVLKFPYLAVAACLIVFQLGTVVTFVATKGQFSKSIRWGVNGNCKEVFESVSNYDRIWTNSLGCEDLYRFYRKDKSTPSDWRWKLSKEVPKSSMIKYFDENRTYNFPIKTQSGFSESVQKYGINKVLIISPKNITNVEYSLGYLKQIIDFDQLYWLKKTEVIELKSKTVTVYEVHI